MHARSGGNLEVMGLMLGKVDGNTMIVMDSFALPVEGTETRVNAQAQAYEYMAAYMESAKTVWLNMAVHRLCCILPTGMHVQCSKKILIPENTYHISTLYMLSILSFSNKDFCILFRYFESKYSRHLNFFQQFMARHNVFEIS